MKINETWMNKVTEGISEKSQELKTVALANKLHKELESKSLSQVLQDYLPVSDAEELQEAALQMETTISDMYASLSETVTDAEVEARLNKALGGHSTEEQGTYLVNLLHCFAAANVVAFPDSQRWQALQDQEEFTKEDVKELLELAVNTIRSNAGILARQEFKAMEGALGHLSETTVTMQMNSGSSYARAYAAAMYITRRQSDEDTDDQELEAAVLGLSAAQSVESSRLLAEYHYGRLCLDELMPRLEALAKTMFAIASKILLQGSALVLRGTGSFLAARGMIKILMYLGIANSMLLLTAFVAMGACCFFSYTQEEAVQNVLQIWEGVKSMVHKIIDWFRGDDPSGSGSGATVVTEPSCQIQLRQTITV